VRRARWGGLLLLLTACSPGPDHERLGDRRYAEHAYADAMAEYGLAMHQHRADAELRTKYAEAALQAGALGEAVEAYRELAHEEPALLDEAADGLARAARLAIGARDMSALADAVTTLRDIAPQRPVGALAVALGPSSNVLARRPQAAEVLLEAAAAAAAAATADSFLVAYADLNARLGRCDVARPVYEGVARRNPVPPLAVAARNGLAGCAVEEGKVLLSAGALRDAEARFRGAIAIGEPDSVVRVAWLLVGDARWADGDTLVALDAYRRAISGAAEGDPVAARAKLQLQRLLSPRVPAP
jgi:tetratricopeptide (TPR) repeat protein